jgi:1-aminocyclopropane-1-carboxylate deaminase/D-cysteine desulfhydrase-like pyridoxal-dependent ACC family enzyme
MKKQLPAILLGIAAIALLVAYIDKNSTVLRLQKELAQLKNQPETEIAVAAPHTASPSGGIAAEGTENNRAEEVTSLASVETPAETKTAGSRRMMENMAKMMENPTMNKVMEASQRGVLGALYSDLIDYLNLDEEEEKYFMDLLMHRQMKQIDLAMKMMRYNRKLWMRKENVSF